MQLWLSLGFAGDPFEFVIVLGFFPAAEAADTILHWFGNPAMKAILTSDCVAGSTEATHMSRTFHTLYVNSCAGTN